MDALSRALEEVISEKHARKSTNGAPSIYSSVSRVPTKAQPLMSSTLNAKTFRDVDSQADRFRSTIKESMALQMQVSGSSDPRIHHFKNSQYPVPKREGVFDRNIKDGIQYADAKTKARRFELDKISQAYNPNRLVHVSAADALIDPHITIRHEDALPKKDPRYVPLTQQGTFARDSMRRVITDYTGTPIIKVDQEGGIFDQQLMQGTFKKALSPKLDNSLARTGK